MITVVPVELADAALAADVTDGLALVEEGLRDAARAEHFAGLRARAERQAEQVRAQKAAKKKPPIKKIRAR